jgi:transcriptional regulator with XRE-family HTH domain
MTAAPPDASRPAIPAIPAIAGIRAIRAGSVLAAARRRAGLTQEQLAQRASVPQSTISVYERGGREPTVPTLERLLRAAGFRVELELVPLGIDTERNGRVLRDLLGLVDAIPAGPRRGELAFPRIGSAARA